MMLARRSARPLTTLKTPNAVPCNSTGAVSFTHVLLAKLVSAGSPLLAFLGAFTPYDIVDEADSEEMHAVTHTMFKAKKAQLRLL